MAKVFYAQRLPQETIDLIAALAVKTGMAPADVICHAIACYESFAGPPRDRSSANPPPRDGVPAQRVVPSGFEFVGRKPTATEVGKAIGVPLVKRIDAALAGSKRAYLKPIVSKERRVGKLTVAKIMAAAKILNANKCQSTIVIPPGETIPITETKPGVIVSKPKSRVVDLFAARKPILKPGHKTL